MVEAFKVGTPTIKKLLSEGSRFRARGDDLVINIGNRGELPAALEEAVVLNHPSHMPANKLHFYREWEELVPPFTTDKEVAAEWPKVVARANLTGFGGRGLTYVETANDELPDVPLYTKYIPKRTEWRVLYWVHEDDINLLWLQKKLRREAEHNHQIRNLGNGFVFATADLPIPQAAETIVAEYVNNVNRTFGGLDVIWNEHHDSAYILEDNSAPAVEREDTKAFFSDNLATLYRGNTL